MPDLMHTLQGNDLGFLKIVAGSWGIELSAPDTVAALPVVVEGVLEHADFAEVVEALPRDAKDVLQALLVTEGRMPWAAFVRKFGEVRRMGSARRDRERPDLRPATAVEVLWYRGLIGRAFLSMTQQSEPQEYAYIPDDLLPLLPTMRSDTPAPLGRPATPNESAHVQPANDQILDHACTLLAALRRKVEPSSLNRLPLGDIPPAALQGLLQAAGLVDYHGLPHPDRTRAFLEAPRGTALAQLARAWMDDKSFNELHLLPGLKLEGEWKNNPHQARKTVLELISQIPENRWWSISAFIAAIREQNPDFQRPAGDYDSWFIRQESSGNYLRGFSAWDEVDGALVRFLLCGPMHWLGLLDLARPEPADPSETVQPGMLTAVRLSEWAQALWHGEPPALALEEARIKTSSDGRIRVPARAPRAVRYQIARFCTWEEDSGISERGEYQYRVTPSGLAQAREQGLRAAQLISLLRRHHEGSVPPSLVTALERWETSGTQTLVERVVLLRVASPEILSALRKTRAARCLGESLNETSVLVRPGMEGQVLAALAEIGYLAEARLEGSQP